MSHSYPLYKQAGFFIGPILFICLLYFKPFGLGEMADKVVAVAAWMVIWWMAETVSLAVTALLPMVLFPIIGVFTIAKVAPIYASPIVWLFFGGFVIALAMEKVNLHKRIALNIIRITGNGANRIILGFMLSTALLSMWISNTASTVVMLPIALSVIHLLIGPSESLPKNEQNFALSIMLGIAFAANIGGTATLIGTPPNSVLVGFLENTYGMEISFARWFIMGFPFAVVMLFITYWILVKIMFPNRLGNLKGSKGIIDEELKKLGKPDKEERRVLLIFVVTALMWISRGTINRFFEGIHLTDASISMMAAFAIFALPMNWRSGHFVIDWKDTSRLPWGILILFGGGLALAQGLSDAGIIDSIGQAIAGTSQVSILMITALLIFTVLFMTELMSNVALVAIFVPVVAGIAIGLDIPILYLTIPMTLASSCAFMLPMATPPNAIVFASGHIRVHEMARIGIILNLISVILLIILSQTLVPLLF